MKFIRLLQVGYIVVIMCLLLYSFTQIDLGLTLIKYPFWYEIQKMFQSIGYFQRPLSTIIYGILLLFLFGFYGFYLIAAAKKKISTKSIWIVILVISIILTFSYNAFSYDLFNYIFDAKIVTYYHQNPFVHKALDFPTDPMLSFMHWVERIYPYGPSWLLITVPLSFIGGQIFTLTFLLFKILMSVCYVGSCYFIGKIAEKIKSENKELSLILFALNPLVIIESLVSSHNDIVMIFLLLCSINAFLDKKNIRSLLLFFLSVGIKFVTVFFTPFYIFVFFLRQRKKQIHWDSIFFWASITMIVPVILESFRTNFQPWYLLTIIQFIALGKKTTILIAPLIVMSFAVLLQYLPFLYVGNWNPPIPTLLSWIMIGGLAVSLVTVLFSSLKHATIK